MIILHGVQVTRHVKTFFDGFFKKKKEGVLFLLKTNWVL